MARFSAHIFQEPVFKQIFIFWLNKNKAETPLHSRFTICRLPVLSQKDWLYEVNNIPPSQAKLKSRRFPGSAKNSKRILCRNTNFRGKSLRSFVAKASSQQPVLSNADTDWALPHRGGCKTKVRVLNPATCLSANDDDDGRSKEAESYNIVARKHRPNPSVLKQKHKK